MLSSTSPALSWLAALVRWLPRGAGVDPSLWQVRHRGITLLLWGHVLGLPVVAVLRGEAVAHGLLEGVLVASFATVASVPRLPGWLRSASATLGLLTSSAILVHVFDGLIEAHFHFFVVVAVVALYQAWPPFLLALGFVLVHHAMLGLLAPTAVFNHAAAQADPAVWAVVHGAFVLAESVACLLYWRTTEDALARERAARLDSAAAHEGLARAQELSRLGSWDWNLTQGTVTWSDQLYALVGEDPSTFSPSVSSFLDLVHEDDRARVESLLRDAVESRATLDYECRVVRADGAVRTIHARGDAVLDADGTLTGLHGTVHDITERVRMQEEIRHLAFHDALTGLANRRLFVDRLLETMTRQPLSGRGCAVMFLDLDGFKAINDSLGHATGDAVLQEVAHRLRSCVRDTDTVARFGGDEFAVLCDDADLHEATQVADRIAGALNRPAVVDGTTVEIAGSIGIALAASGALVPGDGSVAADVLLREADAAMYAAKSCRGQGPTCFPSLRVVSSFEEARERADSVS